MTKLDCSLLSRDFSPRYSGIWFRIDSFAFFKGHFQSTCAVELPMKPAKFPMKLRHYDASVRFYEYEIEIQYDYRKEETSFNQISRRMGI